MRNVGKPKKHTNYFEKCNRKVCDFANVVGMLNACVNIVAFEEGMCVHE
jgi:hypothetical protein